MKHDVLDNLITSGQLKSYLFERKQDYDSGCANSSYSRLELEFQDGSKITILPEPGDALGIYNTRYLK